MAMMTSQILKSVDFTKTQESRYLEKETLFFLQIKNLLTTHQGLFYDRKSFVAEVTFKELRKNQRFKKLQHRHLRLEIFLVYF